MGRRFAWGVVLGWSPRSATGTMGSQGHSSADKKQATKIVGLFDKTLPPPVASLMISQLSRRHSGASGRISSPGEQRGTRFCTTKTGEAPGGSWNQRIFGCLTWVFELMWAPPGSHGSAKWLMPAARSVRGALALFHGLGAQTRVC